MQRWERRERRKQSERQRMEKHGKSVRLLHALIQRRAAQARRQRSDGEPQVPRD